MYILIYILIILAVLVALVLIIAAFTKKDYSLRRDIIINRANADVFNYIKYLKNQDNFNKWTMMDPGMKKEFTGTDGTVGFVYAWDGNKKAGAGEQEIKSVKENERLDAEIRFVRPMAGVAKISFDVEALAANQTGLSWVINSTMKYPMNFLMLFMSMDKLLGKDMEASLLILKGILEKN